MATATSDSQLSAEYHYTTASAYGRESAPLPLEVGRLVPFLSLESTPPSAYPTAANRVFGKHVVRSKARNEEFLANTFVARAKPD